MVRRYFGAYGATHYGYFGKRPRPLGPWEATLRMQAAARGFLARRMVRAVRDVEQEAEGVAARLAALQQASSGGDASVTAAEAEEELMRLLLRLDAVRGARAYRRRVVARVITLQGCQNLKDYFREMPLCQFHPLHPTARMSQD